MKTFKLWMSLLASLSVSSVAPALPPVASPSSAALTIDWPNSDSESYLSPISVRSCFLQHNSDGASLPDDVLPNFIVLNDFSFTWSDPDTDLYIDSIKLIAQDPHFHNGSLEIVIDGNELASLDGSYAGWMKSVAHASSPTSPSQFVTQCPLFFGGIMPEIDEDFNFKAVIEVNGFSHNYNGTDTPLSVQKEISLVYFKYY